jgi:hypothetical protein
MTFKYALNLVRRYPVWAKHNCIFVHVPKAAGTSVNRAIYGKTLGHYKAAEIRRVFPGLFARCFAFAFVRNPWDRALSAYRFARIGRTAEMGIRNAEKYKGAEFSTFRQFVTEWLAHQDLSKCDYVFQRQCDFLCDANGALIVDFVGRTETIGADMAIIEGRLGRRLELPRLNQVSGMHDFKKAYTTEEMIEVIGAKYEQDIRLFGYEF